jgi:hypothetical protein
LIASGGDREDVPEAFGSGKLGRTSLLKRRNPYRWHRNRRFLGFLREKPGGCPCSGQVVPGVEAA